MEARGGGELVAAAFKSGKQSFPDLKGTPLAARGMVAMERLFALPDF